MKKELAKSAPTSTPLGAAPRKRKNVGTSALSRKIKPAQAISIEESLRDMRTVAAATLDKAGKVQRWNQGAEILTGYAAEELLDESLSRLWVGGERRLKKLLNEAVAEGFAEQDCELIKKSGERVWVVVILTAHFSAKQKLKGFALIARDASKRKKLERDLNVAEKNLSALLERSNVAVTRFCVRADKSWEWESFSNGCRNVFGYMPEELAADKFLWQSRVAPDDFEKIILPNYENIFASRSLNFEYRFRHKDGSLRWISAVLIAYRNDAVDCWNVLTVATDITERKEMEIALRQSKDILAAAVSSNKDWIAVIDRDYRFTVMNDMVRKGINVEFGIEPKLGDSMLAFVKKGVEKWKAFCDRAFGGETVVIETRDGSDPNDVTYFENVFSPIKSANGAIEFVSVSSINITERKRNELQLQESQKFFEAIYDQSSDAQFISDANGIIIDCNLRAVEMYECDDKTNLIGRAGFDFHKLPPAEAELELIEQGRATGNLTELEVDYLTMKGSSFRGNMAFKAIEVGGVRKYLVRVTDITERKRAEEKLRRANDQFRAVLNAIPGFVSWISSDMEYLGVNEQLSTFIGKSAEEYVGQKVGRYDKEFGKFVHDFFESDAQIDRREVKLSFTGEERAYLMAAKKYDDGNAAVFVGIDITDRQRAEELLRYQANVLENVTDAIISTDMKFVVKSWNAAAEALYGWTAKEAIGRRVEDLFRGIERDAWAIEARRVLLRTGRYLGEGVQVCKDGSIVHIFASATLIRDEHGKPIGGVTLNRDITAQKVTQERLRQAEEQLRQAQKMEAIGTLTGGIAHDFNNLLNGILGNIHLLKNRVPQDEKMTVPIERIDAAAKRAASLTSKLLGFARKGKLEVAPVSIPDCVAEVIEIMSNTIDKRVKFSVAFEPHLPNALGDRNQLKQVILNLVINACDAVMDVIDAKGAGQVVFGAAAETLSKEAAEKMQLEPNKPYLHVTVTDNGAGIPKAIQHKIFEPFFTTKVVGKGTGLGLAMIYGIMKNHAGAVFFESDEGQGATFHLFLPAETRAPQDPSSTPIASSTVRNPTNKNYVVLVIDDEHLLREMLVEALREQGFQTLEADGGQSGVRAFEKRHQTIDAVILDLNMPDMNGERALQEMKKINPDALVVITAGFAQSEVAARLRQAGAARIVMKPYDTDELGELLVELLKKDV